MALGRLVSRTAAGSDAAPAEGAHPPDRRGWLALAAGIVLACSASAGWFTLVHVPAQRAATLARWERELWARAEMRKLAIERWSESDAGIARMLASNPIAVAAARSRLAGRPDASGEAHLAVELAVVADHLRYRSALLFDARGTPLAAAGQRAPESVWRLPVRRAVADGVTRVDFAQEADGRADAARRRALGHAPHPRDPAAPRRAGAGAHRARDARGPGALPRGGRRRVHVEAVPPEGARRDRGVAHGPRGVRGHYDRGARVKHGGAMGSSYGGGPDSDGGRS